MMLDGRNVAIQSWHPGTVIFHFKQLDMTTGGIGIPLVLGLGLGLVLGLALGPGGSLCLKLWRLNNVR